MTSGSELEAQGNQKQDAGKVAESKTDEMNDSGHSSVNTPECVDQAEQTVRITVQPTVGDSFELQLNDNELAQELFHSLMDREATCHRTCFSLALNGNLVDIYSELRAIPGFADGCTITVVDEPYTTREARLHIRQFRELLKFGLNQTAHDSPCNVDMAAQAFLPTINMQHEEKGKAKELRSTDVLPPDYVLPGSKERSLSHLVVPLQKPLYAIKSIAISPYNPPTGPRKMKGDVLYIDVNTVENRPVYITCCTKGFYLNNSQDGKFDPTQSNSLKTIYQSLVELLTAVSPGFKKTWPLIMQRRAEKSLVERLPTPYPVASWVAPPMKFTEYSEDYFRAVDLTESHRFGLEDHMPGSIRDWNEELQTTFELPRKTIHDRLLRDRNYFKAHMDFVCAAAKGVQAILDGNIVAINSSDDKKTHMYIWNNIFFSLGFDVKDHYKKLGGDAAAFAATSIDLQGVRAYASLTDPQFHTLGMAIFDYRGFRVTAQSIIPGILEREQEQSVVYGSIDFGKTIKADEKYLELLPNVARELHMMPHRVLPTKEGDDEEKLLYTSYETKGIVGNDGRKYLLDLFRTMPPDVNFLLDAQVSEVSKQMGFPRMMPHTLCALRRELVDQFFETKCFDFLKITANFVRSKISEARESKDENAEKIAAESEAELAQVLVDITEGNETTSSNPITLEAVRNGLTAVHSLSDTRLEIKFNPDCFSSFVRHAPGQDLEKQRRLVMEAAEFVLTTQIPDIVAAMKECNIQLIDGESLSDALHQRGINIRYLGEIAKIVDTTNSYARPLVLSDILCRSTKHVFRGITHKVSQSQLSASLCHFLNCFFFNVTGDSSSKSGSSNNKKNNKKSSGNKKSVGVWASLTTASLWKSIVDEASSYYGYDLKADSLDKFVETHDIQKTAVLRRFCRIVGLQIVARDYQLDNGSKKMLFTEDDIVDMFPVIKHHNPEATDAKKIFHRGQQALHMGSPREAFEFVAEAVNLMTNVYGVMHPELAHSMRTLARLSHILQENSDALNNQHKAVIMSERMNGLEAGSTIVEYINLAHFAFSTLVIPGALRPLYRARYLMNLTFGEKHPIMAQIDANIGIILFTLQEFDFALKYLVSADHISKAVGEPKRMKTALITNLIARTHAARGDFRAALVAEKETFATYSELYGPDHQKTRESSDYLKTLTQQAVMFQKKMMEANKNSSISELFQIQPPTLSWILDVMNIVNGFYIYPPYHAIPVSTEKLQIVSNENKTDVASQHEIEALD
ncbi:unnamed protein product [Caenorhabditis bovis]|uniref:Clustered mitochondria protein homolog n=1 Tax=Caenorhabditis bovis TaxID=2654633 RepID=A0A8S1ES61_9PELO|nr:unnamed protein product [Caenorhabditis bovis]